MNRKELNWAAVGCGSIAEEMAAALERNGRRFYSVAGRTRSRALDFAARHGIGKVYEEIDDVFEDPHVDAIYICTPHNHHIEWIRKGLKAGRHVLCEKAITLNSAELAEAVELAEEKGVILGEAMTIYHMPLYRALADYFRDKDPGPLTWVQVNFGSYKPYDMKNRFFNPETAGGALLDIGVYALSFVRWFFSEKPDQIRSLVERAETGVDESAGILLKNPVGQLASVSLSLHAKQPKRGIAAFDKAYVEIWDYPRTSEASVIWTADGHKDLIRAGETADALYYEVLDLEEAAAGGRNRMYLDLTRDVMDVMTALRKEWGLVYPEEQE